MPMSTKDLIHQVQSEVDLLYGSYSYVKRSKEWAFAQYALQVIFPALDPDQAFNLLAGPLDSSSGIHAGYRDEQSGTYYLFSVRYPDDPGTARNGPGVVYQLLDLLKAVATDAVSGAPAPTDQTIRDRAVQAAREEYTLSAILVLFGELDNSVDLDQQRRNYGLTEQQLIVYDIHALRRLAAGMNEEADGHSVEVQLRESTLHKGPVEALLGSVTASQWREAFAGSGSEIYDVNVRTPLGLRSKINKQMTATIASNDRRFFWYYNNGITVLCRSFREVAGQKGRYVVESPRIVNGAQTTEAILSTPAPTAPGAEEASVPVRFIAALPGSTQVSPDLANNANLLQDLYLNIAKYTNSQNPIELPDFRSNEDVQRRLHDKFKRIGWFYQHRRGQWDGLSTRSRSRYKTDGSYRKIEMVELAQEWFAFTGHPSTAIRARLSLFEEQGHYSSIFMLLRSAEEYLVAHLLFQQIQSKIKERIADARAEAEFANESGGMVSLKSRNYLLIGRATKLAVAHLTALLGRTFAARLGAFDAAAARMILPLVQNGTLIDSIFDELEDTLFRALERIAGDKYKTFHQYLSESGTSDSLYEVFKYVIDREESKGRSPIPFGQRMP